MFKYKKANIETKPFKRKLTKLEVREKIFERESPKFKERRERFEEGTREYAPKVLKRAGSFFRA